MHERSLALVVGDVWRRAVADKPLHLVRHRVAGIPILMLVEPCAELHLDNENLEES